MSEGINSIVPLSNEGSSRRDRTNPAHYELTSTEDQTHAFALDRPQEPKAVSSINESSPKSTLFKINSETGEEYRNTVTNAVAVETLGVEPVGLISKDEQVVSFEGSVHQFLEVIRERQESTGPDSYTWQDRQRVELARTGMQVANKINRRPSHRHIQPDDSETEVTVRSEIIGAHPVGDNTIALFVLDPRESKVPMNPKGGDFLEGLGPDSPNSKYFAGEFTAAQLYLQEEPRIPENHKRYLREVASRGAVMEYVSGESDVINDDMRHTGAGGFYEFISVQERSPSPGQKVYEGMQEPSSYRTMYLKLDPEVEETPYAKPKPSFGDVISSIIVSK